MRPKMFEDEIHRLRKEILNGVMLDRGEWQGKTSGEFNRVLEAHNVTLQCEVSISVPSWQEKVQPNLPWAEDHFMERVGGEPLNPGEQYKNWPYYEAQGEDYREGGKFSHTYMERFWPKYAGYLPGMQNKATQRLGINSWYGDLNDLVELLIARPMTRQAYLPIWFPEDLDAAGGGERVPCTLGYHFQRRPRGSDYGADVLDITYFMRSCDYFRYLRDDVYMAGRLLQWIVDRVEGTEEGRLTMHIINLHVFADERVRLEQEHKYETQRRLSDAL